MGRRAQFAQIDVTRAYRGLVAAGIDPRDVSVVIRPDGEMRIEPIASPKASSSRTNTMDALIHAKNS